MRGDDNLQEGIFSYISPEKRVPADHPLRPIRITSLERLTPIFDWRKSRTEEPTYEAT
jgi:hypothetical protein